MDIEADGSEKFVIVVLEDEPLTRLAACEVLIDAGFHVIETDHADKALQILAEQAESVHVLFTDVNVPGSLDGFELAHHSRTSWPWIAILVTSGRFRPADRELPEAVRFIQKPYELDHVIQHVREMLA